MKITTRWGDEAVAGLNEALLAKAAAAKLLRTDKVRADTTVVEAAWPIRPIRVCWPRRSARWRAPCCGSKPPAARDAPRSRDRRALGGPAGPLDRGQAAAARAAATGSGPGRGAADHRELAGIAEAAMREATAVIRNARRALRRPPASAEAGCAGRSTSWTALIGRTKRVVAQTRSRLGGVMPESATRLVSLHDVDARPIRKGRLGKPVEFGYKAQIVDNADGVILDHNVEIGNPRRRPATGPGDRADHPTHRTHATRGHRRPRLRRGIGGTRPTSAGSAQRGDPAQE